jgi:hypothetical protein
MQTLKQIVNLRALRQIIVVFLAGILVLVSTACSPTRAATPVNNSSNYNPDPAGQAMYPHKDTMRDTSAADAKANKVIRQTEQRLKKVQSPKDYLNEVTPDQSPQQQVKDLGRSAQQAVENTGDSIQRAAKNAAENTQNSFGNLKENTQKAVDHVVNDIEKIPQPTR